MTEKESTPSVETAAKSSWLKPSLDWVLIFVPIAIALRFVPALENQTALFICSCLAIIPLAGVMGKATEHLAEHLGQGIGTFKRDFRQRGGIDHRAFRPFKRS